MPRNGVMESEKLVSEDVYPRAVAATDGFALWLAVQESPHGPLLHPRRETLKEGRGGRVPIIRYLKQIPCAGATGYESIQGLLLASLHLPSAHNAGGSERLAPTQAMARVFPLKGRPGADMLKTARFIRRGGRGAQLCVPVVVAHLDHVLALSLFGGQLDGITRIEGLPEVSRAEAGRSGVLAMTIGERLSATVVLPNGGAAPHVIQPWLGSTSVASGDAVLTSELIKLRRQDSSARGGSVSPSWEEVVGPAGLLAAYNKFVGNGKHALGAAGDFGVEAQGDEILQWAIEPRRGETQRHPRRTAGDRHAVSVVTRMVISLVQQTLNHYPKVGTVIFVGPFARKLFDAAAEVGSVLEAWRARPNGHRGRHLGRVHAGQPQWNSHVSVGIVASAPESALAGAGMVAPGDEWTRMI